MPTTCCVLNCGSRGDRDIIKFYKLPGELHFPYKPHLNDLSKRRRKQWIEAIRRKDFTGVKLTYSKVCSRHFYTGKPAALDDESHPDWVPSLHMGFESYVKVNKRLQIEIPKREQAQKRRKVLQEDSLESASADECTELERQECEKQSQTAISATKLISSNQEKDVSSETEVCKHCNKTVVMQIIKCIRCNENLHLACLMEAAQLKNAACEHVAEVQGDITTISHETAYLVNIIRQLKEKNIVLEQNCKFLRGCVYSLKKQLEKQ